VAGPLGQDRTARPARCPEIRPAPVDVIGIDVVFAAMNKARCRRAPPVRTRTASAFGMPAAFAGATYGSSPRYCGRTPNRTGAISLQEPYKGLEAEIGCRCIRPMLVLQSPECRTERLDLQNMRLLVVEDNEDLAGLLAKGLDAAGFTTDRVSNANEARTALTTTRYAAVVLDLGLPDEDGLSVLKEIRSRNDPIPVVVLTARAGVRDRVNGLRSGADDYLVKPFAFEELVARLEAVLRRPGRWLGSSLRVGNLVFDTESRQAFIDERPQSLSAREVAVLELLMRRHGRVVTKKLVEDQLFGLSGEVASNAIEVYVHRLRKQLAENGAKVQIHTMRGLGYLISEDK
jgi:DNA-binding response OmpR family regulator